MDGVMCSWPWELSKKKAPRHVKNQPNSWDDLLVPLNLCRICMTTIYEILPDGMACTDFDPFRSGQKTNNTDCGKSPAKKKEKLVCGKCTSCLQNMLGHYSFVFIFFRMVTKGSVSYLSSPCFSTSIGGIGGQPGPNVEFSPLCIGYQLYGGGNVKNISSKKFYKFKL